jgi:6-phosphogluconolactonase
MTSPHSLDPRARDARGAIAPPHLLCFPDFEEVSRAAVGQVIHASGEAAARGHRFHLALSGGSTPRRMLELLAGEHRGDVRWDLVDLWWCDERAVPPEHEDSNFGAAHRILLSTLDLHPGNIHRMHGELVPASAARFFHHELRSVLGAPPRLTLALLGLGADGHTASLFPGSPAVELAISQLSEPPYVPGSTDLSTTSPSRWVHANPVTSPLVTGGAATRLTLTFATLHAAKQLVVVVSGADKAPALREVLCGAFDPLRYPAQLLAASPPPVLWLVDEAAASHLPANWRLARPS